MTPVAEQEEGFQHKRRQQPGKCSWTHHICKYEMQNNDLYHHDLLFIHIKYRPLFYIATRYYCIFLSLPRRENYYRKLYSKYITTGHQFFVPSRAESHTRLVSHLSMSHRHTCENPLHVPFSYNSSFVISLCAFIRWCFLLFWWLWQLLIKEMLN